MRIIHCKIASRHQPCAAPASTAAACGAQSCSIPGTLYSYGPRTTVGMVWKFSCGGGESVAHSSVVAFHGFAGAFAPRNMLRKKFTRNGICPAIMIKQADGCNYVQRLERFVVGVNGRHIDSALAAAQADQEERNKYQVEADPGENEVHLAQGFIHHSAEHLREPIVDSAKSRDDGRRHKGVVEMRDYKIGVMQVDIGGIRPQRNAGYAAE